MDVKFKFNDMNVQDETEQTLVKVLMLKGEPGDPGEGSDLTNYYDKTETDNKLSGKVDKETGKQLSTEDFTTAEKTKLANISGGPNYSTGTWEPNFAYYFESPILPAANGWRNAAVTYSQQHGIYVLIGDLCFVNFSVRGELTNSDPSDKRMGIGGFPFTSNSSTCYQTLPLGACVRYSSSDDSQLWTPTAGIVARLWNNEKYAEIMKENGYLRSKWPSDISNPYYIEGSGVYKIKNSNLSEVLLDTTGSSTSLTTPEGES